jgi:hypothetical protein
LLILYNLNQVAKFLKNSQIIRALNVFFLIVGLKMKKYQIPPASVEQTAECYPIIKKFAKEAG